MRHFNRIKKLAPKLGQWWCWKCDRFLVAKGQKCKICGHREQRRFKK